MSQQTDAWGQFTAWLAVVNWTRECPCIAQPHSAQSCNMCGGISSPHSKLCENCSGTGRIAVLPGLRVPCDCLKSGVVGVTSMVRLGSGRFAGFDGCTNCGGRRERLGETYDVPEDVPIDVRGCGWLPVPESEETLQIGLARAGVYSEVNLLPGPAWDGHIQFYAMVRIMPSGLAFDATDDDPLAALLAAAGKLMAEEASHA